MSYLATYDESLDDAAKRYAGNWRTWECFAWSSEAQPTDADRVAIIYTHNRDSGCLDESNAHVIRHALAPFEGSLADGQDVQPEDHGHWAVGWVKGFAVRVYDASGAITPAFRRFYELAGRLEQYCALDENDWSEREHEAADRAWKDCYSVKERIRYIREHRSDHEFRSFADMLGCVRGGYFAGDAGAFVS